MRLIRSFDGVLALAALGMLIAGGTARAQTARSGGAPNAELFQQMQQLASERTGLQAENARMKKELDDLRKERDQLKKGEQAVALKVKSGEAALARSAADRASTEQQLTQTKAKLQELIDKFRETLQTLSQVETDGTTAKQALARRDQELKICTERNAALYKLNDEVLTHFDKQGLFSRVAHAEPFTQIKRVQLENLIDDYRARAQEQLAAPSAQLPDAPGGHSNPPATPPSATPSHTASVSAPATGSSH